MKADFRVYESLDDIIDAWAMPKEDLVLVISPKVYKQLAINYKALIKDAKFKKGAKYYRGIRLKVIGNCPEDNMYLKSKYE
jgi:hypothetical protein